MNEPRLTVWLVFVLNIAATVFTIVSEAWLVLPLNAVGVGFALAAIAISEGWR